MYAPLTSICVRTWRGHAERRHLCATLAASLARGGDSKRPKGINIISPSADGRNLRADRLHPSISGDPEGVESALIQPHRGWLTPAARAFHRFHLRRLTLGPLGTQSRHICRFLHMCVKMPHFRPHFSQCENPCLPQPLDSMALKIISRIFCTISHFLIPI